MTRLVSILIPAYNAEPWIADTIRSALAQTWPRKEIIIVVDGGCRDQTPAIAQQFASETVCVVARPHQSAAAARNEAYTISQGDYIQWLDADDLMSPDKISRQMQVAEEIADKRILFSCAWGSFFYRPSKAEFYPTPLWRDLTPEEWLIQKMGRGLHMQPATWLISREVAECAGAWNGEILVDEDGEYFCRLVLASEGIRFVPGAKVFYRASGAGSYTQRTLFDMEKRWTSVRLQFDHLRSLGDSERVRAACVDYLQEWLIYFYPQRPDIVQQAEQLAASLGGKLKTPPLRWKYAWLQKFFGYAAAKRTQFALPELKCRAIRSWDKAMFQFQKTAVSKNPAIFS